MQVLNKSLKNSIVLITGASSGIGAASALAFAQAGAKLVLGTRRKHEGESIAAQIRAIGGEAVFIPTDILIEADVERLVQTAITTYGRLDVAFNNAGTEGDSSPFTAQACYEHTMNTNVRGVFWSMQHEIRAMLPLGGGAIINNASIAAQLGFANLALYTASKHAVMGLTKVAALEYFKHGIRVNAVCPGVTFSAITQHLIGDLDEQNAFMASTPAGRVAQPEEIAAAVLFLASKHASYISGQSLTVDGGYSVA